MAIRIQRAWRNYMRYKHECARRIQRFWKNNKEGIVYAQVRDYGHQILASRKERRRFSLLSYRRFFGDYLDIEGKNGSPLGETIREKCSLGCKCKYLLSFCSLVVYHTQQRKRFPSVRNVSCWYLNLADLAHRALDIL